MNAPAAAHDADVPLPGIEIGKLGIWVFLASEVMLFSGLIAGYIVLRMGAGGWPAPGTVLEIPLLAVNTFILICSSVTMVLAVQAAERREAGTVRRFLALTALLGGTFLGVKIFDYTRLIHDGVTIDSSLFGSVYFTLTGLHGLHVFCGIVALLTLAVLSLRGAKGASYAARVEYVGLYWHFVDIVWILLFVILCLL